MHSRKMVAAMQAARSGDSPILLRTSSSSGTASAPPARSRFEQVADVTAFVLWQLR